MDENDKLKTLGEFLILKVADVRDIGVFLEWDLPKDLFLPYAEQTKRLEVGDEVIVFTYLDRLDRLCASMRLNRNPIPDKGKYKDGQEVQLWIAGETDLGFKAIVDGKHWGLLFRSEVFQDLAYAQKIKGFIKQVRRDGKLDLILQNKTGHKAADDIGPQILGMLKSKGGFAPITDKTSAEVIYKMFKVSKKKFKIALGGLYKKRLIKVGKDGIRLIKK